MTCCTFVDGWMTVTLGEVSGCGWVEEVECQGGIFLSGVSE